MTTGEPLFEFFSETAAWIQQKLDYTCVYFDQCLLRMLISFGQVS